MASELELAGLLSQVEDDAGDEEIFAAQWQHESDNEPLAAAVYLMSNADPARIAGGAAKVKALRSAAKKYSLELSATPPAALGRSHTTKSWPLARGAMHRPLTG